MRTTLSMMPGMAARLFDEQSRRELEAAASTIYDASGIPVDAASPSALSETEVLITSWGSWLVDDRALDLMPNLKLILHAAGSVRHHLTPEVWRRGIRVSSAAAANAVPVAEYTLAMILLAGKQVPWMSRSYALDPSPVPQIDNDAATGNLGLTLGIVGASKIGARVVELARPFDIEVLVYDPHIDDDAAANLGAERTSLEELAARSDILSIHAPALEETHHLISRDIIAMMPDGATLINTARASVVDQDALVEALRLGRIHAILDVTEPEVLEPGSELLRLPNVWVTPHVAGARGNELVRIGRFVLNELGRYRSGQEPAGIVRVSDLAIVA